MKKTLAGLSDHIIVVGMGAHGAAVVEELLATGWPLCAVDRDVARLERMRDRLGGVEVPCVIGDATDDATLTEAGVERARALISALPQDPDNLFVVVTARQLAASIKIVAKAEKPKSAEKLRKAGADSVVMPSYIGGVRMVSEIIRPQVVEFLDLMLRDRDKNLRIEEVLLPAGSRLHGKPLAEARIREKANLLVLAIRDPKTGSFVYNPGPTQELTSGMALIVLGESDSVHMLRRAAERGFDPTSALQAQK